MAKRAARRRFRYQYEIDPQLRISKSKKQQLLDWINSNPAFRHRRPTEQEVITAARRGPLRGLIEFNRDKAARIYWRERAQYLLRHINEIKIDLRISHRVGGSVRAFMPIRVEQAGRIPPENYVPASRVMEDPSLRLSVVERAHNEFRAWLARYEAHAEFMEVFSPVLAAYRQIAPAPQHRCRRRVG